MSDDLSKDHECRILIIETHFYKGKLFSEKVRSPVYLKKGDKLEIGCDGIKCVP
jgi:hypothetical protein